MHRLSALDSTTRLPCPGPRCCVQQGFEATSWGHILWLVFFSVPFLRRLATFSFCWRLSCVVCIYHTSAKLMARRTCRTGRANLCRRLQNPLAFIHVCMERCKVRTEFNLTISWHLQETFLTFISLSSYLCLCGVHCHLGVDTASRSKDVSLRTPYSRYKASLPFWRKFFFSPGSSKTGSI